jgi:hypothetical protein
MIDNGQVKNQSGLAHKLGISRVRIHQILSLLKFDSLILQELEKLGDPLKAKIITKRMLRPYSGINIDSGQSPITREGPQSKRSGASRKGLYF